MFPDADRGEIARVRAEMNADGLDFVWQNNDLVQVPASAHSWCAFSRFPCSRLSCIIFCGHFCENLCKCAYSCVLLRHTLLGTDARTALYGVHDLRHSCNSTAIFIILLRTRKFLLWLVADSAGLGRDSHVDTYSNKLLCLFNNCLLLLLLCKRQSRLESSFRYSYNPLW